MIKNIVFDMDGVLLDTEAVFMRCWKKLGEELHLPNVEETARKCIGITVTQTEALFQKEYGEKYPCESYVGAANAIFYRQEADGSFSDGSACGKTGCTCAGCLSEGSELPDWTGLFDAAAGGIPPDEGCRHF